MRSVTHTPVIFSLIQTPCCQTLLCWINPRMPNFCPECGKAIWLKKYGSHIMHQDKDAWLDYEDKEIKK